MANFCQQVLTRRFLLYSMNETLEITNHRENTRGRKLNSSLQIYVFIDALRYKQAPH